MSSIVLKSDGIRGPVSDQLINYNAMCRALAACHGADEVKKIRDKALALEVYAAQAMNTDAERKACEIRLRAERRAGELLREMKEKGQRSSGHAPLKKVDSQATIPLKTLSDLGISADQSSKWQQLAEVPEREFEAALADPTTKPSTARLIAKQPEQPKMDPQALWLWGRLRDFERERISDRNPQDVFNAMTDTMRDDVRRIVPVMIVWLEAMERNNGKRKQ